MDEAEDVHMSAKKPVTTWNYEPPTEIDKKREQKDSFIPVSENF